MAHQQIRQILQLIIGEMGVQGEIPDVSLSEDSLHGEYTTNIALKLSKQLKKKPLEIAAEIKDVIYAKIADVKKSNNNTNISGKIPANSILQDIEKIEVAPPGFINIFITEARLSTSTSSVLNAKERFGTSKNEKPLRVTVEFTDPNPFKEFHLGHLYSNSVGESLSRLLESQGNTVRRVNYQGDVGMHVAKAMYGLKEFSDIEKKDMLEKVKILGQAYAAGAKVFEESDDVKKEIERINKQIYEKDPSIFPQYEKARKWSLDYFESIYARLGTKFEGYYFESVVGERGATIVRDHVADGVFTESQGAIVYDGKAKGLHTRVFINKLGLPTYEAKELGLAPTKYDDWAYDRSIIITGNEINEYFKVLLSALSDINPELASKTEHMGHGMVRKADGSKMSSRSGQVLSGEGLLDEVKSTIYSLISKNESKYSKEQEEEIAEKGAVAAVKYSLLRVALPSDVHFDPQTSVSFEGDSGVYLLYTYARCKSVLRKATGNGELATGNNQNPVSSSLNPEERSLARLIFFFPEIVQKAAEELAPNVLCTYLFKLAQTFNLFYQKHTIVGQKSREDLTAATAQTLHNGLYLLGIKTVERM